MLTDLLPQIARSAGALARERAKGIYYTVPIQVRYGGQFRDVHRFLMESQWWSKQSLQSYQMEQLSRLLKHACENVPYYRRVFSTLGLKPNDIQDFDDFRKIPFLTK